MAYQKKDPSEVSAARSRAAKMRRHKGGGRPKGVPNKNSNMEKVGPSRSILVREVDHAVFAKLAYVARVTMVEFMHLVAENLKQKNQNLFEPPSPQIQM